VEWSFVYSGGILRAIRDKPKKRKKSQWYPLAYGQVIHYDLAAHVTFFALIPIKKFLLRD
jgi:hypothetical protein